MARKAKSIETLLAQVNARWPDRDKSSDGWLGDTSHQTRKSDHNPNSVGVVQAYDFTNDPASGLDSEKLAEALLASRDPRIKYVISNKKIAASYATGGAAAWTWRPYSGANAHNKHCHVSVSDDPAKYDDPKQWNLALFGKVLIDKPKEPSINTQRQKMAQLIIGYEARRDSRGHITVYVATDGSKEVAGINNTYHPAEFTRILGLISAGQHASAEVAIIDYILAYTAIAATWTTVPGVEFYLRDCVFNRGPKGGARILQRAVSVPDDGAIGPATKAAMAKIETHNLLTRLRAARESYERDVMKRNEASPVWKGLVNRWNKSLEDARQFGMGVSPEVIVGGGAVIVAGGGAVVAASHGMDWLAIGMFMLGITIIAGIIVAISRRHR
jgi:hypothetical protein